MALAAVPDGYGATRKGQGSRSRREREFRLARRHSARVRALKFLLPLLAAGVLSLYALPSFLKKSIDNGRGVATVSAVKLQGGALKMIDPHVKGVNDRGEAYDIMADSATQQANNPDVMYLEVIRGKMTAADGKVSRLTAPDGINDSKAEEMTFEHGMFVTRDGGMSADFQTAKALMKQQLLISKTPVVVRLHESTIHADSMTLWQADQRAVFEGHVRTHLERQEDAAQPGKSGALSPGTPAGQDGRK